MRNSIKIVIVFYLVIYSGISYAQNTENYKEKDLNFISNGNKISGKLIIPLKEPFQKLPMVVFVHGSGPEDYSSSDNYSYLFEKFTEIGFACYSWDRPGVGNSEGKWYEKSVKERAQEVIDAVKMLKTIALIDSTRVGFWGISQAGWVIPEVAGIVAPAFVISVSSPATTAIEQELYRVKASMRADGFSRKDIKKAIAYTKAVNVLVDTYRPYAEFADLQNKIKNLKWSDYVITGDEIVYRYLSIVFKDDEPPAFKNLNCQVLAIWGENDLVVPPKKSARVFENKMRTIGNQNFYKTIVPDADHTLTFNLTGKGSATGERREQYKDNQAEVFAPGYVSLMTNWLQGLFEEYRLQKNIESMNERIITVDDVELYTESFGSKDNPAILLVAGATVSMLYWDEEFCQRLADKRLADKGFYVIRYDNRDVGKSTFYKPGTPPYNIVDLTNDAIAILDGYGIENAHFVGMSLGGLIAQIASIKHPERVASLTLMSTGPWGDSDPAIPEMDTRILDFHAKSGTIDWTNEDRVAEYLVEGAALMSGRKKFDGDRSEKLTRAEFNRANNYISMFNHAALQGGEEYYNRLDEIKQPTLIIHGTDDLIWHFKNTSVLLNNIKGSKLIKLKETGHELHFEDWDTIIEGIENHINSIK